MFPLVEGIIRKNNRVMPVQMQNQASSAYKRNVSIVSKIHIFGMLKKGKSKYVNMLTEIPGMIV